MHLLVRQLVEWHVRRAAHVMHVVRALRDEDQPRDVLAFAQLRAQELEGLAAMGRVVILVELAQPDPAAVVHLHGQNLALGVGGLDLLAHRDVIRMHGFVVVLARELVTLRRADVVVERDARRDDVDHREALVHQSGLDQRHELLAVAGEAARDERAAEREGREARVDRRLLVLFAFLGLRADVRGCRELAFRQPVDAVVLAHVQHVHVAADRVRKLAETDRQRIAVAGHADVMQVAIRGIGAGRDRWHAAMHAVEAVRATGEVGGRLRRAANTGQLGEPLGSDAELPDRLGDRSRDRIVPAACAERRHRAFVVTAREAELVLRQVRVPDFGFIDERHFA